MGAGPLQSVELFRRAPGGGMEDFTRWKETTNSPQPRRTTEPAGWKPFVRPRLQPPRVRTTNFPICRTPKCPTTVPTARRGSARLAMTSSIDRQVENLSYEAGAAAPGTYDEFSNLSNPSPGRPNSPRIAASSDLANGSRPTAYCTGLRSFDRQNRWDRGRPAGACHRLEHVLVPGTLQVTQAAATFRRERYAATPPAASSARAYVDGSGMTGPVPPVSPTVMAAPVSS